jgi:hypothetical protein
MLLHESLLVDKRMGAKVRVVMVVVVVVVIKHELLYTKRMGEEVRVVMPWSCGCCCNRAKLLLLLSSFCLCSLELEVLWLVLGPNPRF